MGRDMVLVLVDGGRKENAYMRNEPPGDVM